MKKGTKAPQRRTELDRIVTQLQAILRRDTTSIIEKGKLLLRSRELLADEHGQWMPWLVENFDMSYRSAINYCNATKYVTRERESATVANLANIAPTVLYRLAEGGYTEQEEAGILAQAKSGKRIDQAAASAICDALVPPDPEEPDPPAAADDDKAAEAVDDAEVNAIIDGPPPAVPPPAPSITPNFALQDFDQAISALKRLMTKSSAQFISSIHSGNDLENVESFIHAVADRVREAARGQCGSAEAPGGLRAPTPEPSSS
jgi:hypothetical protein